MIRSRLVSLVFLVAAGGLAACGSEDPASQADGGPGADARVGLDGDLTGRYLPLAIGNSWTYRVVPAGGAPETKVSEVEALEDVGGEKAGITAFRVRTTKPDGITLSWQEDTGTEVLRHREEERSLADSLLVEQIYLPARVRLDETAAHLAVGAMWDVSYTERTTGVGDVARIDQWTVEAVDEQVVVPAGTFSCLRVRRIGAEVGQANKVYWFARGVGKVKEEGGQLEELSAYGAP